jgi:hypothetical protein
LSGKKKLIKKKKQNKKKKTPKQKKKKKKKKKTCSINLPQIEPFNIRESRGTTYNFYICIYVNIGTRLGRRGHEDLTSAPTKTRSIRSGPKPSIFKANNNES